MGLLWRNGVAFWYFNDSTCQFYYKVNTCVRPHKKNGRGVTFIMLQHAGSDVPLQMFYHLYINFGLVVAAKLYETHPPDLTIFTM